MEIVRNHPKKLLRMCQEAYIERVSERFRMHCSKPIDTLVEKSLTLSLNQSPKIDQKKEKMKDVPYTSAVENLMYAMSCKQLDICFAVGLVSHYQSNLGPTHWQAVKRIMFYLHGTTNLVL